MNFRDVIKLSIALIKRVNISFQVLLSYFQKLTFVKTKNKLFKQYECSKPDAINKLKEQLRTSFVISIHNKDEQLKAFKSSFLTTEKNIRDANKILNNEFNFLGSGPKRLKKKINWNMDLATGRKWPMIKSKKLPIFFRDNSDIIRVWELSRFQWGPTLGKAYWLTNKTKYLMHFKEHILHWIKRNPIGYGPNWISSQDVALRAVNWIITLCFIDCKNYYNQKTWQRIFLSIYNHGVFIEKNLDLNYMDGVKTTGNHYVSNLLGLLYLGILFRDTPKGKHWLRFSINELVNEMDYQVNADGGDYESSIAAYHRFTLEHFLSAYIIFLINGIEIKHTFAVRLEKMFEFIFAYTRQDGTVPQIGDGADGRFYIFANFYDWRRNDHRYLLPYAAFLFNRPEFEVKHPVLNEDAFWTLFRVKSKKVSFKSNIYLMLQNASYGFPQSGFFFMKNEDASLAISANPVGQMGKGSHKHNDIFSIDLFYNGTAYIVDPGSYVYTTDLWKRHQFRTTSFHNVLQINNYEQNEIKPDLPWRVKEKANPIVHEWIVHDKYDYFRGEHSGFGRYIAGLKIERQIFFYKKKNYWILQDRLLNMPTPNDELTVSNYFHLENLKLEYIRNACKFEFPSSFKSVCSSLEKNLFESNQSIKILSSRGSIIIHTDDQNNQKLSLEKGWISRSYGIKETAIVLKYEGKYSGQDRFTFVIEAQ